MRVTDLVVKDDDLVVATNGRSIWILDDLTAIRAWSKKPLESKDVTLLPPRARPTATAIPSRSHAESAHACAAGDNPPKGAFLHYHLKSKPKGEIVLKVLDAKDNVLRTLSSKKEPQEIPDEGAYGDSSYKQILLPTEPGLHRVAWDLRLEGADTIRGARVDTGEPRVGPLVTPGVYTIKVLIDGKTLTSKLEVLLCPRREKIGWPRPRSNQGRGWRLPDNRRGTLEVGELDKQFRLAIEIRDEISLLVRTTEQLRSVRRQMQDRGQLLADDDKSKPLLDAGKALDVKLTALESKLHNPKAKISYDILAQKGGAQLYSQLAWLFELLKESDGIPTQGLLDVHRAQSAPLKKYVAEWQALVAGDIARMNALAKKLNLPGVIVPDIKPGRAGHPAPHKRR